MQYTYALLNIIRGRAFVIFAELSGRGREEGMFLRLFFSLASSLRDKYFSPVVYALGMRLKIKANIFFNLFTIYLLTYYDVRERTNILCERN